MTSGAGLSVPMGPQAAPNPGAAALLDVPFAMGSAFGRGEPASQRTGLQRVEPPPPAEENPFEGLTAIGPTTDRKAREWSLVLQSSDTWHLVRWTPSGFIVLVRDADYEAASTSIDRYEAENKDFPPRRTREQPRFAPSAVAPLIVLALAAFFLVTGPAMRYSGWFQRGTAVTELVLSSEPWRAVTALTLHADTAHLIGNAISGTVFASAVHRRLGPGGGSLAILAAGTLGNVANAFYHVALGEPGHRSIGFSTAVFGAIGLLAATQLFLNRKKESGERGFLSWAAPDRRRPRPPRRARRGQRADGPRRAHVRPGRGRPDWHPRRLPPPQQARHPREAHGPRLVAGDHPGRDGPGRGGRLLAARRTRPDPGSERDSRVRRHLRVVSFRYRYPVPCSLRGIRR